MTPTDVHKIIGRWLVDPFGQTNRHSMVLAVGLQRPQIVDEQRERRPTSTTQSRRRYRKKETESVIVVANDGRC